MKKIAGFFYNDVSNRENTIGNTTVKIFYPVEHNEDIAKKNMETIKMICNQVVSEKNQGDTEI